MHVDHGGTNTNIILGVLMAVALVLCLIVLLYHIRRNPKKAQKLLLSFLRTEIKIAVSIAIEGFDLVRARLGDSPEWLADSFSHNTSLMDLPQK